MEIDDLLPISGLEHLLFCPRQCALIHIEGQWDENALTIKGKQVHERAHLPGIVERDGVRIERSVPLRSDRLGLIGKADIVEFHREKTGDGKKLWRPFPVEYKRGRRRRWTHNEVQVCAQALCLEEMLGVEVPCGAIYYAASKKRLDVIFDNSLREITKEAAEEFHKLMKTGTIPPPRPDKRCRNCSLINLCMPDVVAARRPVAEYINSCIEKDMR